MSYPEVSLGSAQIKILTKLREAGLGANVQIDDERALEKLFKKGFVRWQSIVNKRTWTITKQGLEALEKRLS